MMRLLAMMRHGTHRTDRFPLLRDVPFMQPSRSDLLARIACFSPRETDREGCMKGTSFFTAWREDFYGGYSL
jgi:hypothetical protein